MNEQNERHHPGAGGAGEERLPPSPRRPHESYRPQYLVEDDRSYYMYPTEPLGSRREAHAKPKLWYNQRWVLALALSIGVAAIVFALTGLTQEVAGVSESIQEQTAAIEEQTSVLAGIERAVADLTDAVAVGFERLIDEIRSAASQIGGGGSA